MQQGSTGGALNGSASLDRVEGPQSGFPGCDSEKMCPRMGAIRISIARDLNRTGFEPTG